jgi:hypothetical protein
MKTLMGKKQSSAAVEVATVCLFGRRSIEVPSQMTPQSALPKRIFIYYLLVKYQSVETIQGVKHRH